MILLYHNSQSNWQQYLPVWWVVRMAGWSSGNCGNSGITNFMKSGWTENHDDQADEHRSWLNKWFFSTVTCMCHLTCWLTSLSQETRLTCRADTTRHSVPVWLSVTESDDWRPTVIWHMIWHLLGRFTARNHCIMISYPLKRWHGHRFNSRSYSFTFCK